MSGVTITAPARLPTPRQSAVLAFVRAYIAEHAMPPTVREIAAGLDLRSTNSVAEHLVALEQKGYLRSTPGAARSWRPV